MVKSVWDGKTLNKLDKEEVKQLKRSNLRVKWNKNNCGWDTENVNYATDSNGGLDDNGAATSVMRTTKIAATKHDDERNKMTTGSATTYQFTSRSGSTNLVDELNGDDEPGSTSWSATRIICRRVDRRRENWSTSRSARAGFKGVQTVRTNRGLHQNKGLRHRNWKLFCD